MQLQKGLFRWIAPVWAAAALIGATGCSNKQLNQRIAELEAENEQLQRELMDRDGKLQDALARETDCRDTLGELERQLAQLRDGGDKDKWVTMSNFDMISIPGELLFGSGSAELTRDGRGKLAQIAADIRSRYSDRDIYVIGYTDTQPIRKSKWRDNWELGAQRALSVIRTLNELGVDNDRLVQANCGEYRPKVERSGDVQANRRVEFYAVPRNTGALKSARYDAAD